MTTMLLPALSLVFLGSASALASESTSGFTAHLESPSDSLVQWASLDESIEPGAPPYVVIWKGTFLQESSTLLLNEQKVRLDENGRFEWRQELRAPQEKVLIQSVSADGVVDHQEVFVTIEKWSELSQSPQTPKPWSLHLVLGLTALSYQETDVQTYSMLALSGKLSFHWTVLPRLDIEANLFSNLAPLVRSNSNIEARQLGANVLASCLITNPSHPVAFGVAGGFSMATMLVTNAAFGFKPLLYPQIFPFFRYRNSSDDIFNFYLKYIPLNRSLNPFAGNHREIASGLSWSRGAWKVGRLGLSIDVNDMSFVFVSGRLSHTSTISLAGVYSY